MSDNSYNDIIALTIYRAERAIELGIATASDLDIYNIVQSARTPLPPPQPDHSLTYGTCTSLAAGQFVDLDNLDAWDPDINQIARTLGRVNRWSGHPVVPVPVLIHSLACGLRAAQLTHDPAVILAAYLHDASEAVVGDVIRPVKKRLGNAWTAIERPISEHIFRHFGIDPALLDHPVVHAVDNESACYEAIAWHMDFEDPRDRLFIPPTYSTPANCVIQDTYNRWFERVLNEPITAALSYFEIEFIDCIAATMLCVSEQNRLVDAIIDDNDGA